MKIALASFCVAVLHLTQAMWFNTASKNNFLDEMAHVQNMSQWCKHLNIEDCEKVINSVPTSLIDENGKVLERFENDFTGNVPEANFDTCSSSLQTVMMPKRPGYSVWPPCTRAFRCSGCCTNAINSCQPLTTSEKQVKVIYTKLRNPVHRHTIGDIDISLVSITEHNDCMPKCKTKEEDCHIFQKYVPSICSCVCRPERESLQKTCKGKQIWDEEACNCVCVNMNTTKCSSSSYFSTETCRCQLKSSASGETYISQLFKRMKTDLLRQENLKENQHVSKEIEVKMVAGRVTVFGEETLEENANVKESGEKTIFLCDGCYL
ncbi:uncharacterized protein LOC132723328 [Ruditapes philippinarum]|uniref:uncharacterized protein LOC132723328 n=1 Tax=Ruditapes philippinarum TaxID=129788 RepID=UPI00295B7C79|nr:uncharacterized protein LOC132723328 [Ruditapes philippinarum]